MEQINHSRLSRSAAKWSSGDGNTVEVTLSPDRNIHVLVTKRGADAFELDAPLIDISNADSVGDIIAFFDVDAVDPGYWCSPQGDHIDVVLEDTGVMRVFVTEKRGRYFGLGGRVSGVSLDRTLSGLVAEG